MSVFIDADEVLPEDSAEQARWGYVRLDKTPIDKKLVLSLDIERNRMGNRTVGSALISKDDVRTLIDVLQSIVDEWDVVNTD